LEAQGNGANFKGSHTNVFFPGDTTHSKVSTFGLFTGQIGYAWNSTLLYVKAAPPSLTAETAPPISRPV
jgi:outer membrane immunogenic protein